MSHGRPPGGEGGAAPRCARIVEMVSDYLDGALAPADRARFEEHVATCAACRTHVEQMRITIARVGALAEEQVEPETMDALLGAFRALRGPGPEPPEPGPDPSVPR